MPLRTQTLHVSIVDDDDSVRKGLSRLMRSAGIQSQASNNRRAGQPSVSDWAHRSQAKRFMVGRRKPVLVDAMIT